MFLKKSTLTLAMTALLAFFVLDVCAQWSPGGTVVYMGDLNLAGNMGQSGSGAYIIGSSGNPPASDVPINNSSLNSTSLNNSSINNASVNDTSLNDASANDASIEAPKALAMMDLSGYAKNRVNKNLAGYTNIMYPLAESAGFTATSAGGSSGGGGCCGG